MTNRDLGAHLIDEIIQIGAVVHVREKRAVHLFHLWPVGAVRVRDIQVVALVPPRFVEDLLELLLEIDIGAEGGVQATCTWLRRLTIGVDDEQGRTTRPVCAAPAAAPASTTTAPAVRELMPVEADAVVRHTREEW